MTIQHPCSALFESIGRDEAAYAELLDVFLEDAPQRVAAIQAAAVSGDAVVLAREAHSYKGSASLLEAGDVVDSAHRLELLARENMLAGAAELADRLASDSAALFAMIRRYRSAFLQAA